MNEKELIEELKKFANEEKVFTLEITLNRRHKIGDFHISILKEK